MQADDIAADLQQQVLQAHHAQSGLRIVGGGSKDFYVPAVDAPPIDVSAHRGIVNYAPSELVVTARAGTRIAELNAILKEHHQCLTFEPPEFDGQATLGGSIATAIAGPGRVFSGGTRDAMLGVKLLSGDGKIEHFGGEVMKNVAGYDVSRLMCGAQGSLGIILEVSIKVMPIKPHACFQYACDAAEAIQHMHDWMQHGRGLSGLAYDGAHLHVRLEREADAITTHKQHFGVPLQQADDQFWEDVREWRHPSMQIGDGLWRIHWPPCTPPIMEANTSLLDWGGQRQFIPAAGANASIRQQVQGRGGHTHLHTAAGVDGAELPQPLLALHRRIKASFDPHAVLNPGRLVPLTP